MPRLSIKTSASFSIVVLSQIRNSSLPLTAALGSAGARAPLLRARFDGARPGAVFKLGARGMGYYADGDAAGAIHVENPRHAQHRVGVEVERIEEIVIDPAIDHVDRPVSLRGAHRNAAVDDAMDALFRRGLIPRS